MGKEKEIEKRLIEKLRGLNYTFRDDIRDRNTLELNFRQKFAVLNCEELKGVELTDLEFDHLLKEIVNSDVYTSSKKLRERNTLQREDNTFLQYILINIKDWCKNEFEIIHQLRINTDNSHQRYDVILLINGLPIVQIELKALYVSPRRAMEQIIGYKNNPGNGYTNTVLCFIQLFIVSNQTDTYYFANNNNQHFSFNADEKFLPVYRLATQDNEKITHLDDFTEKFLSKYTLAEMISRYMVLVASEQKLLVMRPYQIYAVKAIIDCIQQNRGNGYIWHTTGSGKTLTSFKASTLLKDNPYIEKCLFVVDRKDLDRQTRDEFNKFQEGCVEENTDTKTLVEHMLSGDYSYKVIVTTIQKLGLALGDHRKNYKQCLEKLRDKRIVFIFDECHRSQFGDNHNAIKEFFPNAQLFGFTGTPIFDDNATYKKVDEQRVSYKTTENIFQKQLHTYTITHAIDDRNVLRFHIDYFKPEGKPKTKTKTKPNVSDFITQRAIVEVILTKHDAATHSRRFNAILATSSINSAIEYQNLFKEIQQQRQAEDENFYPLNIACVFSPPAEGNKDVLQIQEDLPQEKADNEQAPDEKKKALKVIIADYNRQYDTNHSIDEFDLYYQDVQKRIKDHKYSNADYPYKNKIDIVIVVDMLLTGFDSKYINTLYIDKNLKYHGLIQAFSRTNRVLNDTKPCGNILDFRGQQDAVNNAIVLFAGKGISHAKKIWLVDSASEVIKKFEQTVFKLDKFMNLHGLACKPEEVNNLKGDESRAEFINHFKEVQRLKIQLDQYTDLSEENKATIEKLLPKDQLYAFRGMYLETAKCLKAKQDKSGNEASLEVQQLDFEFVLCTSTIVDYDYIMRLIAKYTQCEPSKQEMTREQLINLLSSSANLMNERDDIAAYINSLDKGKNMSEEEIREGYQSFKVEKISFDLAAMAQKYGMKASELQTFVDDIMSRMIFDAGKLNDLFAPLELRWKVRAQKKNALMDDLVPLLKKMAQGSEISGLAVYET